MRTSYFQFLKKYPQEMGYLLSHSFVSGFGQTFLLALFVPHFKSQFGLSGSEFGLIYSGATLLSALTFPWVGALIDRVNLKFYSPSVCLLLLIACLTLANTPNLFFLITGLYLVRLAGQSLMTHIATTMAAKRFEEQRGKALGVVNLGFPIGEGLLPPILGYFIGTFTYEWGFYFLAAFLVGIFLPLSLLLYSKAKKLNAPSPLQSTDKKPSKTYRFDLLKKKWFILLVPSYICPAFLLTGIFLHQSSIEKLFQWPSLWFAKCFFIFALCRVGASLLSGPLIDRFSAKKIYPLYLLPLGLGLGLCMLIKTPVSLPIFLSCAGVTMGLGSTAKNAVLAELMGTGQLGAVRSLAAMLMAISTAISPWLFGKLFDLQAVEWVFLGSIGFTLISLLLSSISLKLRGLP